MRVGVRIAQSGCFGHPAGVRLAARAAEQVGYASLWTVTAAVRGGEVPGPDSLDPVSALAVVADATSRLRLGTSVPLGRCAPALAVARSLARLDQLPVDRLSLGLDVDDASGSDGGVEPSLLAVEAAWRGRRRPPVLLTTSSARGIEQVARRADGWSPAGLPLDVLVSMWRRVRELAPQHGRDPDALQLVVGANIRLCDRPADRDRAPYCGTIEQVVEDVDQTRRAGTHEVVLGVHGDPGFDEALALFAAVAEALELRTAAD